MRPASFAMRQARCVGQMPSRLQARGCQPHVTLLRPHLPRPRIRLRCEASAAASAAGLPTPAQQPGPFFSSLAERFINWWRVESPKAGKDGQPEAPVKLGPVLRKLWELCAPDAALLVLASIFMVIASLGELAIPHYATKSIFAASEGTSSQAFMGFLSILTGMVAAYGISAALRGFCFSILNNRMTRRLRTDLFESLSRRETAFFDSEDVGNLTSRLQADCQAMTKVIATNANIAVRNLLQAIGGVIYLYLLSPSLCAVTVAISGVLWAVTIVYGDFARRMQKIFQDVLAESNTVAEEALTLSRVVRTFGTEAAESRRYVAWLDKLYEVGKRQAAGYAAFVATGHIACYASKVAALAIGCTMVLHGALTAEQLTNFIMYVEFVTYASLNVCDEFTEICEAVGASERVVAMLGAPPAPQLAAGATLPSFSGRVELRNVCFSYPSRPGAQALNHVSLELQPGKLTALVGLSGSGKTTVCSLLQRLYDPASGQLLLDGSLDVRQADAAWYRQQIGVVPQEPRLFSRSVAANISYGMEHDPPRQADVEAAARAANAHDFIMALPQGYETPVTEKLLSGGQKQRLALARALIRKPKVLVLDEFSSALDAESEAQVHTALDAAMASRERTVVVIAHRLTTVRNADCIVVMDRGQVHEMGSHHELLSRRGIYWQLVCRQQYGIDPAAAAATDTDSESILAAAAANAAAAAAAAGLLGGSGGGGDAVAIAVAGAARLPAAVSASAPAGALAGVRSGPPSAAASVASSVASVAASRDSIDLGNPSSGSSGPASASGSAFVYSAAAAPTASHNNGNGNNGGNGGGGVNSGSTASLEDDGVSAAAISLGAATDDASGGADTAAAAFSASPTASGQPQPPPPLLGGLLGVTFSSTSSLTTMDDDGPPDEAGRPAASGKMMSAVLAGRVVGPGESAEGAEGAEAEAEGAALQGSGGGAL